MLANDVVDTIGLAVARLPLGLTVVVAGARGTVRALDLETGRVLWTAHVNAPKCLSTTADIIAIGTVSEIVLLDAATGSSRQVVAWPGGEVTAVALSPEASLLAAGNYPLEADPATVCVRERSADGSGFTQLWSAPAFEAGIQSLSWRSNTNGTELIVAGDPHRQPETDLNLARIFDAATGTLVASLPGQGTLPATARISPSGRIVTLQGGHNKDLTWWKTDNSEPEQTVATTIDGNLKTINWDFDGQVGAEAVIGTTDEYVCRIERSRYSQPTALVYERRVRALTVADDLLITVGETGALTRWDLIQKSLSPARRANISRAWCAQASSLIVSTRDDERGVVLVEDAATGKEVRRESFLNLDPWAVVTVVDEHDLLLVGDSSGRVHGRRSSAVDEEVFLWQIHERPKQPSCIIHSVALHEDLLVTAGEDGAVRFTNWRTGQQALAPVTHPGWSDKPMMTAVVVTEPGGETFILAGNTSGVLLCWQLSSLSSAMVLDGFSLARRTELTDSDPGRDLSLLTWLRQPNGLGQAAIPIGSYYSSRSGYIQIVDIAARTDYRWRAHDHQVTALCDSGDLLYSADRSGIVRCWAGGRAGTPRLVSELPTNAKDRVAAPRGRLHCCCEH